MSQRGVWIKIRASQEERTDWHRKAQAAGVSLSALVRRSIGRVRTWTAARVDLERERNRELARIGNNLNQLARWSNTHKSNAEAVEIIAHLVAISEALKSLRESDPEQTRCTSSSTVAAQGQRSI